MCDEIRLTKITIKSQFENANFKFYCELIPKAAKMKRIPTRKQHESDRGLGELVVNFGHVT